MKIAIIGAGSWGTALVSVLSKKQKVSWWIRRKTTIDYIKTHGRNASYLTNLALNINNISLHNNIDDAIKKNDLIIVAIPSEFLFSTFNKKGALLNNKFILSATKGVIPEKLITPFSFFSSITDKITYGVISGPCHAEEVALQKQSYITISTESKNNALYLKSIFTSNFLQTTLSSDIIGTEYSAILKNIYAILTGVCSGLGYGDNFIAVLITASANELNNLLMILDPKERVITKAAYLGALLVTCYSTHSRNRNLGFLIGTGVPVQKAITQSQMVAEGYHATASIYKIIASLKRTNETPILNITHNIIHLGKDPKLQINSLVPLIC